MGKHLAFIINRNNLRKFGDSSQAQSLRTWGGTPSEPYALLTSSFGRALRTCRIEIMEGGIEVERVKFGGGGAFMSSKAELF